jgi:hypothetical protein
MTAIVIITCFIVVLNIIMSCVKKNINAIFGWLCAFIWFILFTTLKGIK